MTERAADILAETMLLPERVALGKRAGPGKDHLFGADVIVRGG
ncbi:MAG TPA: hypothetical protein PLK88_04430 [Methanothrix sp.]|jgi:hypothetical protein|nr:hypothetical protein [Methanothrix sp.]HQJ79840.1 hypothetical protein [Methanothrix sp.]HUM81273.1 hypothetical protein [Methanothrix sp.]